MKGLAGTTVFALTATLAWIVAAVFLSAWTLDYWQGWTFIATYAASSIVVTVYLWNNDRALLQRRMRGGPGAEQRPSQKIIMLFASIVFVAMLVVPGFDRRFHWSNVPAFVSLLGDALVICSFYFVLRVMRENSFAAATITVDSDQHVISTGPYAVVRHPMYGACMPLIFGMPLALGSWWGLLGSALLAIVVIWRLLDEERFLAAKLSGYAAYEAKVRWRLVPGIF
jgi:protein-S-isoprenylcysteine O-methyltransferase Ste14